MQLLIATQNPHKVKEISALLNEGQIEIKTLQDFPEIRKIEEDDKDFKANALKKARYYAKELGLWTLADDSGLEVDALGGRPGVLSHRYAPTNDERIEKLLKELEGMKEERRGARFACAMALASPRGEETVKMGYCYGLIAFQPRGTGGFGFDPVFFLPELGKTMAQLSIEEKNHVSHRACALRQLLPLVKDACGDKSKPIDSG